MADTFFPKCWTSLLNLSNFLILANFQIMFSRLDTRPKISIMIVGELKIETVIIENFSILPAESETEE